MIERERECKGTEIDERVEREEREEKGEIGVIGVRKLSLSKQVLEPFGSGSKPRKALLTCLLTFSKGNTAAPLCKNFV